MKKAILQNALMLLMCFFYATTAIAQREIIEFNEGWKFHLGHTYDIEKDFGYGAGNALQFAKKEPAPYGSHGIPATLLKLDESDWQSINLPHDWTVEMPSDFNQPPLMGNRYGFKEVGREYPETSIGWYRKKFDVAKEDEGKQIRIEFDGVFRDCKVWVNGFYMGRHWSGYTGFDFDISDYLIYGKENIIAVRVDATLHEGWFYEGSGINKEVYLVKNNPIHIEHIGPQVITSVEDNKAELRIRTKVQNEGFEASTVQVINELKDLNGQVIGMQKSVSIDVKSRCTQLQEQTMSIDAPVLWSLNNPYRYFLNTKVMHKGKVIDTYQTRIGIRTMEFDVDKGFFLNGQREQINGVCIHQNFAGVGSALPEALHYYRLNLLKEMGVNAIRSHYPFSKSMLNACDSLGVLVMDETRASGSYAEALNQLKWMITNHRNHPSILIWSAANEEGGTQRDIIGRRYMRKMVAEAHKYDSTRLVTAGVNAWGGKVDFGFSEIIDVMGFNYSKEFIDEYHKNHPTQPIIGTEVSNATVTRGVYVFSDDHKTVAVSDGAGGYYMPEGEEAKKTAEGHIPSNTFSSNKGAYDVFQFYAERSWLSGSFFWTGFDYNGETWPSGAPNTSSQFGAMDLGGLPKPLYYYYQSWWTNKPVLHIAQHWNWKGMEGEEADVLIHSNCDEVKLLLNGKVLGTKKMTKYGYLNWKVKYKSGTLRAIGYQKGKKVAQYQIQTTGIANKLSLEVNKTQLEADGKDVAVVRVEIKDKKGRLVPLADHQLHFDINGDARILGCGNGDPSSCEIDSKPSRKAFNGKAVVLIQAGKKKGTVKLTAKAEGLETSEVVFTIE
ncbi:MAG: DUF4982 domain-containing protein [Carboxylicivirga sp.]|nr:DUF4982 domain-containing protein [Carboxylicivirga sp.]